MTLKDIKTAIEHGQKIEELVIFKCSGSDFIPHQYIRRMKTYIDADFILLDSLDDYNSNSFFIDDDNVYIYKCDTLQIKSARLLKSNNLFIICSKVDKDTEKVYANNIVSIPKLECWQILDYINFNCPTLSKELEYLADKYDIYTIDNEISKISIFSIKKNELSNASFDQKQLPKYVYDSLMSDGSWNYMHKYSIFDLVQALILNDKKITADILSKDVDINPDILYELLRNQILDIMKVVVNSSSTSESSGLSNGKYWAIKYTYGKVDKNRLTSQLRFIDDIDIKIKTGKLSNDIILDLILIKFLEDN